MFWRFYIFFLHCNMLFIFIENKTTILNSNLVYCNYGKVNVYKYRCFSFKPFILPVWVYNNIQPYLQQTIPSLSGYGSL